MDCPACRFVSLLAAIVLGFAATGCGGERSADEPAPGVDDALAALPASVDGAWSGVLPCIDCDGIEVVLELQREPDAAGRYRLVESYLGGVEAGEFEVAGEWREEPCRAGDAPGACIVLVESGQRWFRHADGTLQAVDADGRLFESDGARLMRR